MELSHEQEDLFNQALALIQKSSTLNHLYLSITNFEKFDELVEVLCTNKNLLSVWIRVASLVKADKILHKNL